ncbi:MAG: ABC transporter substrate-binding protein [Clostridia bacterium]|nr:ABC transporter substrate-binding protein [Clostridia bacterium]
MKKWILILMTVLLFGCEKEQNTITVAEQYGLAYAPIQVMKARGTLEALVDEEVVWKTMANTTAIREALLAEQLDIGFLGIPPFIIGYNHDVNWKIFTGLSESPLALMSSEPVDFDQIASEVRIALPQPGSIQHILLAMAAERVYGDAKYFDQQLVTMKHPDGMQALFAKRDIQMHYTSPPYLFEEEKAGMYKIIDGDTCMGEPFTFIVGVATDKFHDTENFSVFKKALEETIVFMNENHDETVALLMPFYEYDEDTLKSYLYDEGIVYTKEIKGLETFIDFMYRNDYIDEKYESESLTW